MHRTRALGGAVIIATGAVWIAQGSGLLRGSSFMTGDPLWVVLGVVAVAVGIGLMWVGLRRRT
jgi:hypothetical protein